MKKGKYKATARDSIETFSGESYWKKGREYDVEIDEMRGDGAK